MKTQFGEAGPPERKPGLRILTEIFKYIERHLGRMTLILFLLCALLVFISTRIIGTRSDDLLVHFLPVGQGDSELIVLPGGATILVDGGPPTLDAVRALDTVLPAGTRSIDVVIMTHPQLDHYGGLIDVAKRYRIGIFVSNGFSSSQGAFRELENVLNAHGVRRTALHAGDAVRYGSSTLLTLAPSAELKSGKNPNEAALILELISKNTKSLFMSDATSDIENMIKEIAGRIDVLKVSHHGSKFSSSESFLKTTLPQLAFIEVGKNSYGHPTPQTLARLKEIGAKVFRTDKDGLVTIRSDGIMLSVLK